MNESNSYTYKQIIYVVEDNLKFLSSNMIFINGNHAHIIH